MRILDADCVFGRWPKEPRQASVERLLAVMAELGIERGLAVSLRGVFYDHEEGNAETLEVAAGHDQLVPVATVRPAAYASKDSLPGRLAGQGFRMLRLFPEIQGWALEGVLVERLLSECAEAGLPVAIGVGKRAGTASAAVRLVPPGCRAILSDVYYNALAECAEALRRREEFLMELGRTSTPGSVEFACGRLGAGRLVLGTRQPVEYGLGSIEMIRRAEIPEADKAAILGGNLSALLGGI